MNLFNISYAFLWAMIALQSYFIIQLGRKVQAANRPTNVLPGLIEEDHGLPHGVLFPQLEFETVNKGPIDLKQLHEPKRGFLVAFTDAKCSSCKSLYPLLEKFNKRNPQFQPLILMLGQQLDVQEIVTQFQLTIPVANIATPIPFDTGIFPFVYYLTPQGEVITKSVVQHKEQLDALLAQSLSSKAS